MGLSGNEDNVQNWTKFNKWEWPSKNEILCEIAAMSKKERDIWKFFKVSSFEKPWVQNSPLQYSLLLSYIFGVCGYSCWEVTGKSTHRIDRNVDIWHLLNPILSCHVFIIFLTNQCTVAFQLWHYEAIVMTLFDHTSWLIFLYL